eukprot:489998-Pleurochrysis_carterae.AAC.1
MPLLVLRLRTITKTQAPCSGSFEVGPAPATAAERTTWNQRVQAARDRAAAIEGCVDARAVRRAWSGARRAWSGAR